MYDEDRGFGFIEPHAGGSDIFVHAKSIGTSTLSPSQMVEYESVDQARGKYRAADVRVVA
jgi:CspA family cold shock protein